MAAKSSYWGPSLSPDQFAVFHFDVKTMSMRDAEGNYLSSDNDAPLLFTALPEAQSYWFGWRLILGVLLGVRFVWFGASRLMDGIATWSAEGSGN